MILWRRLAYLLPWRRRAAERDMQEELQSIAAMAEPGELGNLTLAAEDARAEWGWTRLGALAQDLRYAARTLRKSRGFTAVALLVLAIGIGASTTIFSVVDAVVLRALPFDDSDRIVVVGSLWNGRPGLETAPTFLDWRLRQDVFESFAAIADGTLILNATTAAEELRVERVTAEFFPLLRVRPRIGKAFTVDNEAEGSDRVAIVSDGLWHRHFGADPNIVGKAMTSEDGTRVIVGVMPPDFSYPVGALRSTDVWVPYVVPARDRQRATGNRVFSLQVLGRMRPGLTVAQVQARIQQITAPMVKDYPKWFGATGIIGVTPLRELILGNGRVRTWMLMLLGAVGFLLLLASVNVANLTLARASAREQQLGVRAALGASRARLGQVLLVESLLLSTLGATCGLVLAWWGITVLRAAIPASVPRVSSIALDSRVLCFAVLASALAGVSVAMIPAWQASRASLSAVLKEGGRSSTAGRVPRLTRSALVVAEVTLAVILLVGAGLFVSSFVRLMRVDVGFDYHKVLTVPVYPRAGDPRWKVAGPLLIGDIVSRVKQVSGVDSVASISDGLPLLGLRHRVSVNVASDATLAADADPIELRAISPDYLSVLRMPLERGRMFTDADRRETPLVTILSREAAWKYFGHADAVGATIRIEGRDRTVVGIVRGVRFGGPETDGLPVAYEPVQQVQSQALGGGDLVIRTQADPLSILPDVKSAIWSVAPELPIRDATTLTTIFERLTEERRFNMLVLSIFGLVGIVIAAVGIYGVMAFTVAERTQEIAVRMALGARPSQIVGQVLTRAIAYLMLGITLGLVGAAGLATLIKTFLFEVRPYDVEVYALAALTLVSAGLVAAWLPARRAANLGPLISLRRS